MNPETMPERGKGEFDKTTLDDASERWQRTAVAAFYRAQARGFAPGGELDDWLWAERELNTPAGDAAVLPAVDEPGAPSKAAARKRPAAKSGSRGRKTAQGRATDVGGRV